MKIIKVIIEIFTFGLTLAALFFFDANPVIWAIAVLLLFVFGGNKIKKHLP